MDTADDDQLHDWVARRHPAPEPVEQRVRVARRRRLLLLVPLALALGALMFFTDVVPGEESRAGSRAGGDDPAWPSVTGLVLMAVGMVGLLASQVRLLRDRELRRSLWGNRRTGLWALTGAQRRALTRQVTGKAAVLDEDLPATREVARAAVAQKGLLATLPFAALLMCGAALAARGAVVTVLALGVLAVMLTSSVVARTRIRQAQHFLTEHPAP